MSSSRGCIGDQLILSQRATDDIIRYYLDFDHEWAQRDVLEALASLATRVGHPYAAERLYRIIQSQEMPDRDLFWSEFLRGTYRDSAVFRLIEWIDATEGGPRDDKVVDNCITLLSLILTTTRRALRDRATRALYLLGLGRADEPVRSHGNESRIQRSVRPRADAGGKLRSRDVDVG